MDSEIREIANLLGAEFKGEVAEYGAGAIGAARLMQLVDELKRSRTAIDARAGASDSASVDLNRIQVSMSTAQKLDALARKASSPSQQVSPTHIAARILEEALATMPNP